MKKFVKFTALFTICLLTSTMLIGCIETAQEDVVSSTQPTEITEYEYVFSEVPSDGNEIEGYREERKKRIETNTFKNEEVIEFLENNGYFIYTDGGYFNLSYYDEYNGSTGNFCYPIVYKTDNGYEVWAISAHGELCSITIGTKVCYDFTDDGKLQKNTETCYNEEFYGLIHYTAKEGEEIIDSNRFRAISYEPATGMIKHWEYGELMGQIEVPANSVFVGDSFCGGYLFKEGTDVWSVERVREDYKSDSFTWVSNIIVHNVEFVITAEYHVGIEEYQPLFLMTDGTLKTYSIYNGEFDVPADDESHLIDVQYEGGYNAAEVVSDSIWELEWKALYGE